MKKEIAGIIFSLIILAALAALAIPRYLSFLR